MIETVEVPVYGSPLSLVCSAQNTYVNTPVIVEFSWSTNNKGTVNRLDDTSEELLIASVVTEDGGVYTCSVRSYDITGSRYIVDNSEAAITKFTVFVSKYNYMSVCYEITNK